MQSCPLASNNNTFWLVLCTFLPLQFCFSSNSFLLYFLKVTVCNGLKIVLKRNWSFTADCLGYLVWSTWAGVSPGSEMPEGILCNEVFMTDLRFPGLTDMVSCMKTFNIIFDLSMLAFHVPWRGRGRKWKTGDWHHCHIDTRSAPSALLPSLSLPPTPPATSEARAPQTFSREMGFISHHPQQLHSRLRLPWLCCPSASRPLETCWNFPSTDIHLPCFSLLYKFIPFCASVSFGRPSSEERREVNACVLCDPEL